MDNSFSLFPLQMQAADTIKALTECNELTARFGLALSPQQMLTLSERRLQALKSTGRIEFGEGILPKLIYTFCDSPFLLQQQYEETLIELQDIFYHFKNESMDRLSDDELLEAMKTVFDGKAQGSLDYLAGTALEELCRFLRGGTVDKADETDEAAEEADAYE